MHSQSKGSHPCKYQRGAAVCGSPWRPRDRCRTARGERQRTTAISAPGAMFPSKHRAGCQPLTTSSWDPGWITSAISSHLSQPETSSPEEMHSPLGLPSQCTREPEQLGLARSMLPCAVAAPVWSIHCKCSPHMSVLLAVPLPLQSTAEQVRPN